MKLPVPRTRDDWLQWLNQDMEFAKKRLMEAGSVAPMFALHRRDGDIQIIPAPSRSLLQKRMVHVFLTLYCVAYDAIGFSFIGEAWMRVLKPSDLQDRNYTGPKPSEAADRIEVVSVTLTYRDQTTQKRMVMASTGEIIRDGSGKPTGLKTIDLSSGDGDMTGDVPDILPLRRPDAAEQVRAKEIIERMPKELHPTHWQ